MTLAEQKLYCQNKYIFSNTFTIVLITVKTFNDIYYSDDNIFDPTIPTALISGMYSSRIA